MKILIIGSGGREHAMAWALARCASVEKVWCAPGNDGMAGEIERAPVDIRDVKATAELAARLGVDLTIAGPELPLVLGIADEFAERGLALLGPKKKAAQLEGSKLFAKEFMQRHGIPTAAVHGICTEAGGSKAALDAAKSPYVIKADGLCAGKGVLVTQSRAEAEEFIERAIVKREFGEAGERVMVEDGLAGEELSYIILTDGRNFIRMAPARDHKRAYDNDEGPNTGGMGAYSTDEILPAALDQEIVGKVVRPTLRGLQADGMPYRGFLYFGLMLTADGPKVLEFNCRLGDPETEAVLLRTDFDLADACLKSGRGELGTFEAKWLPGASVCVVIASKGYPSNPQTGVAIHGLEDAAKVPGAVVFHAGTRRSEASYVTNGGRVLVVSATGENLAAARRVAYEAASKIKIEGAHYRGDIGATKPVKERAAAKTPAT